jgi:hypothetical protein
MSQESQMCSLHPSKTSLYQNLAIGMVYQQRLPYDQNYYSFRGIISEIARTLVSTDYASD